MIMKVMPRETVERRPRRSPRPRQDRAPTRAPSSNAAMAMPRVLGLRVSGEWFFGNDAALGGFREETS